MIQTLLTIALYILATTEAAHDNTDDKLTTEEWKVLKTEYFLQQLMEHLEKEPKIIIKRATAAELPEVIKQIDRKSEDKRAGDHRNYYSCPPDVSQHPDHPCCMDSVEIDFHKLGWNFIISPRTIQYKFCRGSCNPEFVRPALFTKAAAQVLYVSNLWNAHLLFF